MREDDVPETLVELVAGSARHRPAHVAVAFPDESLTYADLWERAMVLAGQLRSLGVRPGDHVGILMPSCLEFAESFFAVAMAGAVVVPLNARYRLELAGVVRDADLTHLLTTDRVIPSGDFPSTIRRCFPDLALESDPRALRLADAPRLRSVVLVRGAAAPGFVAAAEVDPVRRDASAPGADELACLLYTSGTTSAPKGCMLSHRALVERPLRRARERLSAEGADAIFWSAGPLYHVASLQLLLGCLAVGGTFVTCSHFAPAETVRLLRSHPPTTAWPWFPAIMEGLFDEPTFSDDVFAAVRSIGLVGPPELLMRVQRRYPRAELLNSCGMTECGGTYALSGADDTAELRATTGGVAEPGVEIEIREPSGTRSVPAGEVGELHLRSRTIMSGYYGIDGGLDDDRWLHTGDLYSRADSGHLTFHGRLKDMLKVGGENVAAVEIERLLAGHEAVRLVEVVGAPHPRLDEVPVAFVELRPDRRVDPEGLIEFCRGQVAAFKVPRAVYFLEPEQWPMSATKVDKRVLRRWAANAQESPAYGEGRVEAELS